MCRDRNHGDRRCPGDTAEARRLRRKIAAGKLKYASLPKVEDLKVVQPVKPLTMAGIRKEAEIIGALLQLPVNPDKKVQDEIDANNEILLTSLGNQIGLEADKRAGYMSPKELLESIPNSKSEQREKYRELSKLRQDAAILKNELDVLVDKQGATPILEEYAEREELSKKYKEKVAAADTAESELEALEDADDRVREQAEAEMKERLVIAYKEVIAEIRPVGGDIKTHRLDDAGAKAVLMDTVGKDFPSSWIHQSNMSPMMTAYAENRPGYLQEYVVEGDYGDDLTPGNERTMIFVPAEQVENFTAKLSEDGDIVTVRSSVFNDDTEPDNLVPYYALHIPTRVPFDPATDKHENGKPTGEGWKHGYIPIEDEGEISDTKQWYRDKKTPGNIIARVSLLDTMDATESKAAAYHEFSHRAEMEVGNGSIMRLEEAFLKRRTTQNGVRDEFQDIYLRSETPEVGRKDNFMTHYVGKEYLDSYAREVLSTGAETAFAGKMGAFRGLDIGFREDLDHRGFTLGIFTTV